MIEMKYCTPDGKNIFDTLEEFQEYVLEEERKRKEEEEKAKKSDELFDMIQAATETLNNLMREYEKENPNEVIGVYSLNGNVQIKKFQKGNGALRSLLDWF